MKENLCEVKDEFTFKSPITCLNPVSDKMILFHVEFQQGCQ